MAKQLKLRKYQEDCITAVFAAWESGLKRPAVVLPTGAGKTVIFSHLASRFRKENPGERVMILVHREELADQAMNKVSQVAPHLTVGKVKAQHNDSESDVLVCSVQTLASEKRRTQLRDSEEKFGKVGLIITDECHHAAAASYRKTYETFPDALNIGFTATMSRNDGKSLGDIWEEVVYTRSVLNMIGNGYLVDVKAKKVDVSGLDLGDVKTSGGDYQASSLGEMLQESDALDNIATAYKLHSSERPGIVFTPTVATAELAAESFRERGFTTAVVSGDTPRTERLRMFEDFRTGKVQVLSNCMVLTEGFDAPWASCAVIARPTQSHSLYVQMVGRVLRPYPGKTDALVLDVTGTGGMKLKTLIDLDPSVERVSEGESLKEAAEREKEEKEGYAGPANVKLEYKDVDMFGASDKHWLCTPAGVMFLAVTNGNVFLWPDRIPGLWTVGLAPKNGKWVRLREGLSLDMAMAWGEADAEDYSEFSVAKTASWRRSAPGKAQIDFALSMGVDNPQAMRKGELSDAISVRVASRIFDRKYQMQTAAR